MNPIRKIRDFLLSGMATKADLDNLYSQISGIQQIHSALAGGAVLRPMRGWAMSPDAMSWILADLQERESPTVIEFGSGQSTVILASALRNRNGGRLISVEHDPDYSKAVIRQLASLGLEDWVEFRILPLAGIPSGNGSGICHTYRIGELPAIAVDVALIDGPPARNGELTRLAPLEWCLENLKPGGAVYLDDSARPPERKALEIVANRDRGLKLRDLPAEKGLCIIQREDSPDGFSTGSAQPC